MILERHTRGYWQLLYNQDEDTSQGKKTPGSGQQDDRITSNLRATLAKPCFVGYIYTTKEPVFTLSVLCRYRGRNSS